MVIVKSLDTVHKIYSTVSVENKIIMDWKILKQIHTRLGWVIRDLSPRLKKKELRIPTS